MQEIDNKRCESVRVHGIDQKISQKLDNYRVNVV